jgi:hypothetical protein
MYSLVCRGTQHYAYPTLRLSLLVGVATMKHSILAGGRYVFDTYAKKWSI